MNRWNMLHILAPFTSLWIALSLLGKESAELHYYPAVFAFFGLIIICVAIFAPLMTKETLKNFTIFFVVYPIWALAAFLPNLTTPLHGAVGSSIVLLVGTFVQWTIWDFFSDENG